MKFAFNRFALFPEKDFNITELLVRKIEQTNLP